MLRAVLFSQKAWPWRPHLTQSQPVQDMENRVCLSVFHPVTWEETASTKSNGSNHDSLPAHLPQSLRGWFPCCSGMVAGRGGITLPQNGTDPPPTKRGKNQGGSQHGEQLQVLPSYFICDPWFTTKPLLCAEQWIFSHILFQSNKQHLAWCWPAPARQWPQLWVITSATHEAQAIGIYLGKHLSFFHTCNYFEVP